MLTFALVPLLALHISLPPQSTATADSRYRVEFENEDLRVARVVLAPGERVGADSASGAVIVYLTADLDGRMPRADAMWQAAGPIEMENRGRARFEAIVVAFKRTMSDMPARTTDTATGRSYGRMAASAPLTMWAGYGYGFFDYTYRERVKSETLVDSPALVVTKVREPGSMYLDPLRVDPEPRVIVYLRGGYAWPAGAPWSYGYGYAGERVHRGDVRVLAANTPYTLSNAGSDPSEFIVIAPR
jgi:hypothetical protein